MQSNTLLISLKLYYLCTPAIMKEYIDRVWNYGFAYGPTKLPLYNWLQKRSSGSSIWMLTSRLSL
ncbi:NAD(P)H-dependent oxidoreductase [Brevibacillus fluminis]|uniref:NAD(P)H-dependent oxidoreductase n=1 Tax=Brevibacillus fluminis TaxID=511487 RepID=UPI0024829676|nr:NAD(P)H-dependent oxidoreductase [Brevibacillus fluminis]